MLRNGCKSKNIITAIGPCIKQNSYNVGSDFKKRFIKKDKKNKVFFKVKKNKVFFDLTRFVEYQLKLMKITNHFLMLANGNAGSYYYFLNRTWHGRTPGKPNKTKLSLFFDFFPVSAKRKDLLKGEFIYRSNVKWELATQPNLNKISSKKNYNTAVETFEKTSDAIYSLSMKANSYNTILKNKFYFTYIILKLISIEILFIPITLKRFFKNLIS